MHSIKILASAAALGIVLGGCAGLEDPSRVRAMTKQGDAFQRALHSEYVDLAQAEWDEYDMWDSDFFIAKAGKAGMGQNVLPQEVAERELPADTVSEITTARGRLMAAFDKGGRTAAPPIAARAQAMFDCWIQEQEENFQPEDIARCKLGYTDAMAKLDTAMAPPPPKKMAMRAMPMATAMPAPMAAKKMGPYMVYFGFDKKTLDAQAHNTLASLSKQLQGSGVKQVLVVGHADTKGSPAYNARLAQQRARAVAAALGRLGIDPPIKVQALGEHATAINSGDNVRESLNRRVEIQLVK